MGFFWVEIKKSVTETCCPRDSKSFLSRIRTVVNTPYWITLPQVLQFSFVYLAFREEENQKILPSFWAPKMPLLCLLSVASNILFPSCYMFVVFCNNFLHGVAYWFQIIYLVNDRPGKWSHTYIPRTYGISMCCRGCSVYIIM